MRLPRLLTVSLLSALPLALTHPALADNLIPAVGTVVIGTSSSTTTYNVPLSSNYVTYTNNVSDLTESGAVRGGSVTAVQASVSSTPGYSQGNYVVDATLTYVFQVTSPTNQTVGVNITANGQVTASGSSGMFAEDTLSVGYSGEPSGLPPIYLDPCINGLRATDCGNGTSGFNFAQTLNVLTNTNYYILLDVEVGGGSTDIGTASGFIDPTITLDTTDPAYSLVFSPGLIPTAATPEPSSLLLLGTGLAGAIRFARRRSL